VLSYSLKIAPDEQFLNWQQDPYGNFCARLVFPGKTRLFTVQVDLEAELTAVNPFDFFVEPKAEQVPFRYDGQLARDLRPLLETESVGPNLAEYLAQIDRTPRETVDFLVGLNQQLQRDIRYRNRLEPGIQTCEQTLELRSGSCRDSAWLLVQILRNLGVAARFVSGYLIQLVPDVPPVEGPAGPEADVTELHAWTEVYLPGAGWIGLDPTSGLLAGEGHLPLACTADPLSAAPISGSVEVCECEFDFRISVTRVREDPRVTQPQTEAQ
jgi:transglutaminase-like putative cysteine protease